MKYTVDLEGFAHFRITVDAENEEDALDAAYDELPTLCTYCGGWNRNWTLDLSEDWDRRPPQIRKVG